jgi:hypothetical protein
VIEGRQVILVAQSLGAFTATLVCAWVRVRMLVFVNAMIPVPGETAGEWWDNTEAIAARMAAADRDGYSTDFDPATYFLHDVPPKIIKQGEARKRPEADIVFREPCRFEAWPNVSIHVIADATIGCFRSTSSVATRRSVCRSRSTSWPVATSSRSRIHTVSQISSSYSSKSG